MIDTLTSTPFFGLGLTLLCWFLAVKLQKRTGLLVCNPVLVAAMLVIVFLAVVFYNIFSVLLSFVMAAYKELSMRL